MLVSGRTEGPPFGAAITQNAYVFEAASMIRLHPVPDASFACPQDGAALDIRGWRMPGMWTVADLRCPRCGTEFWGDLPSGWGL